MKYLKFLRGPLQRTRALLQRGQLNKFRNQWTEHLSATVRYAGHSDPLYLLTAFGTTLRRAANILTTLDDRVVPRAV